MIVAPGAFRTHFYDSSLNARLEELEKWAELSRTTDSDA